MCSPFVRLLFAFGSWSFVFIKFWTVASLVTAMYQLAVTGFSASLKMPENGVNVTYLAAFVLSISVQCAPAA
jgi:hypothetical protein